jgi:NADH-quinone oxidoreductase subunit H
MNVCRELFQLLVFPGFLFLLAYAIYAEWLDRRIYARLQNRMGPPWFQPFADLIKLFAKEDIIPKRADRVMFIALPAFALAAVLTAYMLIPIASTKAPFGFTGDIVAIAYILSVPTLAFFLAGWYSANPFAIMGATRTASQLLAYEVPLLLAVLSPAMLSGSWTISEIIAFQRGNPWLLVLQIPAFVIAIIALQGKLERVPFDTPEAETELVAGIFTEYTGRRLALFRMSINFEMVTGAALIANLFLGGFGPVLGVPGTGIISFVIKTSAIVFILSLIRASTARIRIEQAVRFYWSFLVPAALLQMFILIAFKGWWTA